MSLNLDLALLDLISHLLLFKTKHKANHQGCYSPPPLKKSHPEIRGGTWLITRVEEKYFFIDIDLFTNATLSTKLRICQQTNIPLILKSSLQVVLNTRFYKLTFGEP